MDTTGGLAGKQRHSKYIYLNLNLEIFPLYSGVSAFGGGDAVRMGNQPFVFHPYKPILQSDCFGERSKRFVGAGRQDNNTFKAFRTYPAGCKVKSGGVELDQIGRASCRERVCPYV